MVVVKKMELALLVPTTEGAGTVVMVVKVVKVVPAVEGTGMTVPDVSTMEVVVVKLEAIGPVATGIEPLSVVVIDTPPPLIAWTFVVGAGPSVLAMASLLTPAVADMLLEEEEEAMYPQSF